MLPRTLRTHTLAFLFAAWDLECFVWGFGCEGNKVMAQLDRLKVMAQQDRLKVSWGAALSSQAAVGGTWEDVCLIAKGPFL